MLAKLDGEASMTSLECDGVLRMLSFTFKPGVCARSCKGALVHPFGFWLGRQCSAA